MKEELIDDKICKFTDCLEALMMKMQEADNTCVELSKDISKRDFAVLIFVGKNHDVIMRDIAMYLGIPVSTTTGVIDKLVEKGYLKRYHSKEDRRTIKIGLSKFGLDSYNLLQSTLHHMGGAMLAGLSEKEQTELIHLMERVAANLVNYVPTAK
ncbi:DNA-binding transcriptional regulator, MarR family [Reichenbachiella faecimaris]|uniref:DNA-binding transcriptional regulator, MarR family n=1 Tax=Reichenbachiella faecimaris TaxID=692418 RepID=A0A1W2GQR2_REIFA|nr:MarR family transcriptional regulator [Reichenbachiella faecimaris]SMD39020.1 DNA-binding transcriptional regulator, MarR family [Reichenbachiella faecimaris]